MNDGNNSKSKLCIRCKIEKPLSGFYKHPDARDGFQSICKECQKEKYNKIYWPRRKELGRLEIEVESTKHARTLLLSKGIPVTSGYGKLTASFADFSYADLVAWGCIPIEAKESSIKEEYKIQWGFRNRQQEIVFDGLYMFIIQDTERVFVVPSQDPMIVNGVGQFKWTSLTVNLKLTQERRRASYDRWLWLQQYENRFDLIEEYRLRISESLRSG